MATTTTTVTMPIYAVGGAASTPLPVPTTGLIWPRLDALKES